MTNTVFPTDFHLKLQVHSSSLENKIIEPPLILSLYFIKMK
jgi:hypothetical protein